MRSTRLRRAISPGAVPRGRADLRLRCSRPGGSRPVAPAAFAALIAFDVVDDLEEGADLAHVAFEVAGLVIAAVGAVALWWQLQQAKRHNRALRVDLSAARRDADRLRGDLDHYRAESQAHARGLGEAIDRQFERWELSPAEREVALLLLKGLSHKEAAEVRATSERTVRQQALAVYRKAGLAGRAELAAFFLEDLLQPVGPAAAPADPAAPPAEGR